MHIRSLITGLVSLSLLSTACITQTDGTDPETPEGDDATITASFEGLEPLGEGYVYEGWIIVDGAPLTTGRFQIDPEQSEYSFTVARADADAAAAFVLTIEPAEGDDPAPSDVHVLGGDLVAGNADLTLGHGAALGTDFSDMAGSYICETPSSADPDDFDQGIWWLNMGADGPEASLTLPELPAGWEYEGWVVGPDGPISTGKFTMAAGEDSDGAGATAGPDATPPFPGQDFIDPSMMLGGYAAVISVEPVPDDSAAPFAIKPLVDPMVDEVDAGVPQDMENMSANNPTGSVAIN